MTTVMQPLGTGETCPSCGEELQLEARGDGDVELGCACSCAAALC